MKQFNGIFNNIFEKMKNTLKSLSFIYKKVNKNKNEYNINHSKKLDYILSETCQIPKLANIYKLYLGFKTSGCFVEFGAYDGEDVSNTSGLADLGWKGIYIEPVKEYFEKCVERHKNNSVTVINCAVGDKNCTVEISVGGSLSTISKELVKKFDSMEWSKGYHKGSYEKVEQKRLDDILTEQNVPINFDVLSVDVEGCEWESLKYFNIKKWSPKIVIIELHDNNINYDLEWRDNMKLIRFFEESNYRVLYKDYTNTVYIRNNLSPLKMRKI